MMKKENDAKQMKRTALAAFLETTPNPTPEVIEHSKPHNSDHEDQKDEGTTIAQCSNCQKQFKGGKKKNCGYCNQPACADHLRKRRKRKNKWEKICDDCEDKVMIQIYIKLQAKAQETLAMEEQIISIKYQDFLKEVIDKREKLKILTDKDQKIKAKYDEDIVMVTNRQNKLMSLEHKVESQQLTIQQMQQYIEKASASFKQNCEENFVIMSQENTRLSKQLAKIDKKCGEVKMAIQSREKEIEEAYLKWEERNVKSGKIPQKKMTKGRPQECLIY